MIRTGLRTRSLYRAGAAAALVIAPLVLLPNPFAARQADPLQQAVLASARQALAHTRTDVTSLATSLRALLHHERERIAAAHPLIPETAPAATAYAPSATIIDPATMLDPTLTLGLDLASLREGVDAYRRGDVAAGDAIATRATDPTLATILEWTWLRTHPREAGIGRITRFVADHPDWPGNAWLRKRVEDAFYADHVASVKVRAWFVGRAPETPLGRIALARALAENGEEPASTALIRSVWANDDLSPFAEIALRKQFGEKLIAADDKARADRLMYKEKSADALRVAAASSDKDLLAFEKVRAAAQDGPVADKLMASVPARYAADPALRFAKIQIARRANRTDEAVALMLAAPRDGASLVDGDEWWTERRLLARKLLDVGDAEKAYQICDQHAAVSYESRLEAEFHAGWIALRFLKDPARAKPHFAAMAALARSPMSRARAAYWQGRAAEAAGEPTQDFFRAAAQNGTTYYGQLAAAKVGPAAPAQEAPTAQGPTRVEAVRAVDAYYLAGAKDLAASLAADAARTLEQPEQLRALAAVVGRDRDAKVSLAVGKIAAQRGFVMEDLAFPSYGIPTFSPLPNSAPLPLVYAIARQESAFDPNALSGAGAMGLMQMIASTAKRTAQRAGLAFDALRMRAEPAFNAQLGAAHLGALLGELDSSTILTLAAYNAGGKRVKEWITAYGDPRRPDVDSIDWVERIPFTETRNYVQRVTENLNVYRARFQHTDEPVKPMPDIPVASIPPHAPASATDARQAKM